MRRARTGRSREPALRAGASGGSIFAKKMEGEEHRAGAGSAERPLPGESASIVRNLAQPAMPLTSLNVVVGVNSPGKLR